MRVYDIAVVGAGPAGIMSCIRAACFKKNIILLERNNCIGKKILLSGKGRCNVTNTASVDDFIVKFGRQGEFLRTAFSRFFNQELVDFFKMKGLEMSIERQGRVFPITDRAISIIDVLKKYLQESSATILYKKQVLDIKKDSNFFRLFLDTKDQIIAEKVILAAGGKSFSETGSSGDGFALANKLGHTIITLRPGLVPLKTKESWVKELKGLTLKNIRLAFKPEGSGAASDSRSHQPEGSGAASDSRSHKAKNKKIVSNTGELLFTHFGVSGPLVLDLSSSALSLLNEDKEVILEIDLKPGLSHKQLEERLLREFGIAGRKSVKNVLKELLPHKLAGVFVNLLGIDYNKRASQVTKEERRSILNMLKSLRLHIAGSLPLEEAMVTCGGVSTKEINPRTMESKIVQGLYFAGELIDGSAPSGGYNLQQAFSTGYLAGEQAARAKNA